MNPLAAILARSRRPGRFVEHRRFTLSREQAMARLRHQTVRHPAWYLLEFVQSAVFAGADYLAVEVRPGSVRVAWVGGRPVERGRLQDLFDHLSGDRADPEKRHLVHLAHGINGLLRRRPRRVRLETGDGEGCVRMDLDRHGGIRVGEVDEPVEGTCLVAHFRDAWLQRLGGEAWCEEQGIVEERCQYAPLPILLNGTSPFGYRGEAPIEIFGARHQRSFARDGRRGVVALAEPGQLHTGFRVVVGGVWVATLPLHGLASRPVVGVICDDGLRQAADGSGIVRDARFQSLLEWLRDEATTLLTEIEGPAYRPPPPPRVEPTIVLPTGALDPGMQLPRRFRALAPRGSVTTSALITDAARPLFWCAPEDVARLVEPADPVRLPCNVLILRSAERRALTRLAPHLQLWPLRDALDVEFALHQLEGGSRIVEHPMAVDGGSARIRLHLSGPLPAWGEGVPFAVVQDGRTTLLGGIRGDRVVPTGARGTRPATRRLQRPLRLPRISLILEGTAVPDDTVVEQVRVGAAHLVETLDEVPTDLLAAVLACFVPCFSGDPPRLVAHPQPGMPARLTSRPLYRGGPSLDELLARYGTDEVLPVGSLQQVLALSPIERRFGWGHLGHPSIDGRPVWAVGQFGERWIWLERPELLHAPALRQLIQVGANLACPQREGWVLVERPHASVAALRRDSVEGEEWEAGWELLIRRLRRAALDDDWPAPLAPVEPVRARALGRLGLLALLAQQGPDDLVLRPTTGQGFRSLADLSRDPNVRAVARGGIPTREDHHFAFTLDELRAIAPVAGLLPLDLRAATLAADDEQGWLDRVVLHGPGLKATVGFEHPFEGGSSLLVLTAAGLHLQRAPDGVPGRHVLLEPESPRVPKEAEIRLLDLELRQLAEGRLHELCDRGLEPERAESARCHAMAQVLVARHNGHLAGSTLELARRISVLDVEGAHWGSLAGWLEAEPSDRPPLPEAVAPLAQHHFVAAVPLWAPVHARLAEIVAEAGLKVRVSWIHDGKGPAVRVSEERSSPTRVVILLDRAEPAIARAAVEAGRIREIVLLECARRLAAWARTRGLDLDLSVMQRLLLARRLEEPGPTLGENRLLASTG